GSDKVYDVIGEQFTGRPLQDLIFRAVVEGKEEETRQEFENVLTPEKADHNLAQLRRKVEDTSVKTQLEALNRAREVADMRRMMPAYVRRFFELAAPLVGVRISGDIES